MLYARILALLICAGFSTLPGLADTMAPFSLNLSQAGGPASVTGTIIASGLNFPDHLWLASDGSLYAAETTTTSAYGLTYGWGQLSTGYVVKIPLLANGSFGSPVPVVSVSNGLAGPATAVSSLANGTLLVDTGSGAGGSTADSPGTRQMSFFNPGSGSQLGSINFAYSGGTYNCEHCNGMSLVTPNSDGSNSDGSNSDGSNNGSNRVYFVVGSQHDSAATTSTITMSGLGLSNYHVNGDSVYMMTVSTAANGAVSVTSAPQQVASGLRNPYALTLDQHGDLVIGDNGIDGAHNPDELGADSLNVVSASQIGVSVPDFGFPNSYVNFATGQWVNGDPNALQPLVSFTPTADANGVLQKSEGISSMAYAAPGSLSFVGAAGGEFITFHGSGDSAGTANLENALLYYDFASAKSSVILDAGTAGVGHIDSVVLSNGQLFLGEMSQNGLVDNYWGTGQGAIYQFNLSVQLISSTYQFNLGAPEPGTWMMMVVGLAGVLRRRHQEASGVASDTSPVVSNAHGLLR